VAVASQAIAEHMGIAAVVLGAGRREAVAEAVELLRVERMDREAALHHGLHHGPVRDLDGDPDGVRLGVRRSDEPVRHLRQSGAAVAEGTLSQDPALAVDDTDLVDFRAPVDACEVLKVCHGAPFDRSCQRAATMPSGPCTGAQGANSPLGVHRGQGPGHRSPPGAHGAGGSWLLPIPWPVPSPMDGTDMMAGSPHRLHPPVAFPSALRASAKATGGQRPCRLNPRTHRQSQRNLAAEKAS